MIIAEIKFCIIVRRHTLGPSAAAQNESFRKDVTGLFAAVSQFEVEKLCQRLSHRDKRFVLLSKTQTLDISSTSK